MKKKKQHCTRKLDTLYRNSRGNRSNVIWEMRRKLNQRKELITQTLTEDGEILQGEEKTNTHVANYYEDLYQAREGQEEYETWTK